MPTDPKPSQAKQTPGLPPVPNENPVDLPTLGNSTGDGPTRVKTVGAPLVPAGDVTVVPPPVVLANSPEFDPKNPSNAAPGEAGYRQAARREARAELDRLQLKAPADLTDPDRERIHELHYLVNGQEVPAR